MDGRARPLWHNDSVRAHVSELPSPDCNEAVNQTIDGAEPFEVVRQRAYVQAPRAYAGAVVYAPLIWYTPFIAPAFITPVPSSELNPFKGAIAAMVIALAVLPIVDIALAASDPEDSEISSLSIDTVNAYNDLARTEGTPCAQ
jgi:hypothetical protein